MVKRSRELELIEEEAGIPYPQTALARKAKRARPRVLALLLVGALLLVVEAVARAQPLAIALALALAFAAWLVWRARLSGTILAALAAVVAVLLPLGLVAVTTPPLADLFALAIALVLGLAALPDLLTLIRDAELQHAYGLWARRE